MITKVFVVDVIGEVVTATATALNATINYIYGDSEEITRRLQEQKKSSKNFLLIALVMPFRITKDGSGNYSDVYIDQLTICGLSNGTDYFTDRYSKLVKPVLYPAYDMFLTKLSQQKDVVIQDAMSLEHDIVEAPNIAPEQSKTNNYLDAILIQKLKFKSKMQFHC